MNTLFLIMHYYSMDDHIRGWSYCGNHWVRGKQEGESAKGCQKHDPAKLWYQMEPVEAGREQENRICVVAEAGRACGCMSHIEAHAWHSGEEEYIVLCEGRHATICSREQDNF